MPIAYCLSLPAFTCCELARLWWQPKSRLTVWWDVRGPLSLSDHSEADRAPVTRTTAAGPVIWFWSLQYCTDPPDTVQRRSALNSGKPEHHCTVLWTCKRICTVAVSSTTGCNGTEAKRNSLSVSVAYIDELFLHSEPHNQTLWTGNVRKHQGCHYLQKYLWFVSLF